MLRHTHQEEEFAVAQRCIRAGSSRRLLGAFSFNDVSNRFNHSRMTPYEMGYEISLSRAWNDLEGLAVSPRCTVPFLADHYEVRIDERAVLAQPLGIPAEQMVVILILHYLIGIQRHGFQPSGEWISFKETEGGKTFWPAFQEGVIKPLRDGFQRDRERLVRRLQESLGGRIVEGGDLGIEVTAFPEIFVRIIFWEEDEDLPADVSMLFDRGMNRIYCMEDVSALLLYVVRKALDLDFL